MFDLRQTGAAFALAAVFPVAGYLAWLWGNAGGDVPASRM
jgi:hypothetical protein